MLAKLQLSSDHSQWLEAARKIPCEIAAEHGVVSKGNSLGFQYTRNGECSFLKIRTPDKSFWIEPKGAALFLWNEDTLKEPSEAPLIITEGEFDALSFLASGATHVVSVPNGAAGRPGEGDVIPANDKQYAYLWEGGRLKPAIAQFKKVILATDDDEPGRILRDELAIRIGRSRCWFVIYPDGCKDANEVLQRLGADALQDMIADAKPMVPNQLVKFSDLPQRGDQKQYSAGWSKLDPHFRFAPPQLIVITGVPNAGKSEWAICMLANLARIHGLKGAILQFEDSPERNRRTLLTYAKTWRGQGNGVGIHDEPAVWVDAMFRTVTPNEDVDDDRDFDLKWLQGAIEEAAIRHGCKWVLIDPWNEVEHLWGRQDTEASYLNRAIKQLKRMARRYQIAIIVVAHPTKDGGKNSTLADASLYDIAGGAVWNNKADLGVIVYSDNPASTTVRDIKICKSKNYFTMGVPGTVVMEFDPVKATYKCKG